MAQSLLPQRFQLLLTAVDPNDLVWLGQLYLLVNPIQHGSILSIPCKMPSLEPPLASFHYISLQLFMQVTSFNFP